MSELWPLLDEPARALGLPSMVPPVTTALWGTLLKMRVEFSFMIPSR